jgi:uncharacterized protein (DUF302 family)
MANVPYGFGTTLNVPYEEAVEKVTTALKTQGFGVLTQIDVQATLKQKLNVDHRRYVILGACNPPLAHRALQAEPGVGLLLPCNVIVYEGDKDGESVVSIVDPLVMMQVSDNPELAAVATQAEEKLKKVVAALA